MTVEQKPIPLSIRKKLNQLWSYGHTAMKRGDNKVALRCFKQVNKITGGNPAAYNRMGIIYSTSNLKRSIKYFRKAISIEPVPEAHFNLAIAYMHKGEYLHAKSNFIVALNTTGQSKAKIYLGLAALSSKQHDRRTALKYIKAALSHEDSAETRKLYINALKKVKDVKAYLLRY